MHHEAHVDREFHQAARLARESATFRAVERATGITARWIEGSLVAKSARAKRDAFAKLALPLRLRIVGLLLLCAALTNASLLALLPRQQAPMLPFAVPALVALVGILLMMASSALIEAWPDRFRLRRLR
jgi:hypothetical protein